MEKIRLGVIGTSWWTDLMHLKPLAQHSGAEIVALCGRDAKRRAELAGRYGIEKLYADGEAMINAGGIDALIVAAPDDFHYPISMAAIAAGLDVLCEKPLANTAAEAWAMHHAAEAMGCRTMVMFTWRWQPHFRYLRTMLDAGVIGRVQRAELSFRGGFARNEIYQWRFNPRRANGTAADLGSHMVDLGRWLFGEVASVSAKLSTIVDRSMIAGHEAGSGNDSATLLLGFAGGPEAVIDVSSATPVGDRLAEQRVRVEGDEGTIEIDCAFAGADAGPRFRLAKDGGGFETVVVPTRYYGRARPSGGVFDIYETESAGSRYFVDCLLARRKPVPDFADGARAQEVIDAAFVSDRSGRRVDLARPAMLNVPLSSRQQGALVSIRT